MNNNGLDPISTVIIESFKAEINKLDDILEQLVAIRENLKEINRKLDLPE
jgi:hypothetical protein